MLDKLKIALTLLVVGAIAGAAIVGVYTLTEERIAANREEAQNADLMAIFPDMDISKLEREEMDLNYLVERMTAYDSDGNELGTIFRGISSSYGGDNTVLVGVDRDGKIVKVIISQTSDTTNIVRDVIDLLDTQFAGKNFDELSHDAPSGATQSYNSVWRVVEEVSLQIEGDPTQEAFRSVFEDADSYSVVFTFEDKAFTDEYVIRDADDAVLGYAYLIEYDEDNEVFLIVDKDDVFKGFVGIDNVDSDVEDAIVYYDDQIDSDLVDIMADSGDVLEDAINDLQPIVEATTRIDKEHVVRYQNYYDDEDDHVGYLYTGYSSGFNGMNVIEILINFDGEIVSIEVVRTSDTPEYIQPDVIDQLDNLYGETSVDGFEADDVFAGATSSGRSVLNAVGAALEAFNERDGE